MDNREILDRLVRQIRADVPGFKVAYKTDSWLQKLLGLIVHPFNSRYMSSFTSTFYPIVYFPSKQYVEDDLGRAWKILAHEYVHLWDRKQRGLGFNLQYLKPQWLAILSVFSLLYFVSFFFLLALGFLIALAPWPSPKRAGLEMRGYSMSLAVDYWRYGSVDEATKVWIAGHFTGWDYYRMWPNALAVRVEIDRVISDLQAGTYVNWKDSKPFTSVKLLIGEARLPT